MANAKTAAVLLALLALSAAPLASAIGPHHGRPDGDFGGGGGGDGQGFFGMPWFGGGFFGGDVGGGGGGGAGAGAGGGGGGGGGGGRGGEGGGAWGEGGPWYRRGAVVPPSTVCAESGPCQGKRLTCPARCFRSFSYSAKNGGGGGGGGGCTFDCTSRCVASC